MLLTCSRCPELASSRTRVVPGQGNPRSGVVFIGEAPGEQEDKQGKPFVGPAGKLLERMLSEIGLRREDVYITNTVKCRPPGNRTPKPDEVRRCAPWLEQELAILRPRLVVLLGRTALGYFMPGNPGVGALRGKPLHLPGRPWTAMVTWHPAAVLRDPRKMGPYQEDFAAIARMLEQGGT